MQTVNPDAADELAQMHPPIDGIDRDLTADAPWLVLRTVAAGNTREDAVSVANSQPLEDGERVLLVRRGETPGIEALRHDVDYSDQSTTLSPADSPRNQAA